MSSSSSRNKNAVSPLRDTDVLQQHFPLRPPVVACLVRHLNRDMEEVTTPPSIEQCVVELQSYFKPWIDAIRVVGGCLNGARLQLQFGKAMDINAGTSSSLLNVYMYAVDQVYSRPRLLAHVAREWRALLEKSNREGSCLVMLYHQDLVDAASVSAWQASGMGSANAAKKLDQRKAEAAAAALEPYFEELKTLRFAAHQMCAYLPNEAPVRVIERLRAAYGERTLQLSGVFESLRQQQRQKTGLDCSVPDAENLRKIWCKGYDLALHFLQFGVVSEAVVVFSSMFHMYYYRSEDYSFVENMATVEQLGKMPNLFDPAATPLGNSGYPIVFDGSAELGEGLLFIVACEMTCALMLGRYDAVFARYKSFLQVVREKFTDEATSKITDAWGLFLLLRCALSAMRLNWGLGNLNGSGIGMLISPVSRAAAAAEACSTTAPRDMPPQHAPLLSPDASPLNAERKCSVSAISPKWSWRHPKFQTSGGAEANKWLEEENYRVAVSTERLHELFEVLDVPWLGGVHWMNRLVAKLSTDALEFLVDLAALFGYRATGEVVLKSEQATPSFPSATAAAAFGMPELASAAAFMSLYRTLIETSALGFSLVNDRHLEHALFYKLALSYRVEAPAITAALCRVRLIPFFLRNGWLQLQTIIHRLYAESMDLVMQEREESMQAPLTNDEAIVLKESLLYIIGALGERGGLREELRSLSGMPSPARCWWKRLKQLDRKWCWCRASTEEVVGEDEENGDEAPRYSLSILLKETQVFCLHCDHLLEGSLGGSRHAAAVSAACSGLRVRLGEKALLCFDATCPVNMLEFEEEDGKRNDLPYTLTATLASKKSWADANEATHVVNVTKIVHSSYDEEKLRLHWVWEFQPCRAGEYYLRCITLHVAATTLVYVHDKADIFSVRNASNFFSAAAVGNAEGGDGGCVMAVPRCLISVPEPDIGIKLRVEPPEEQHCFRDTPIFFTVHVDVERPLYFPRGGSAVAREEAEGFGCRCCQFEAPNRLNLPPTVTNPAAGVSFSFRRTTAPFDLRRSFVDAAALPDPSTLALIYVNCPGRSGSRRSSVAFATPPTHSLSRSLGYVNATEERQSDHDTMAGDGQEKPLSGVVIFTDSATGGSTTVPFDERLVMSHLPPLICERRIFNRKTLNDNARDKDAEAPRLPSMRLDGSILSIPHPPSCFRIRLDECGEKEERCGGLPEATSLQCLLPVLPIFMSDGDESSQVSLCCQRNMESCTTSVSVPFRLAPAFAVQYAFKCFQGRVYCLVRVENTLKNTSLWLRGALLELLDTKQYYELSRVSSTHERLMMREWKPRETVHLFFELMPTPEPHAHEESMLHRVMLHLLYSDWSIAEECKPLKRHILLPIVSSSPTDAADAEGTISRGGFDGDSDGTLTSLDSSLHVLNVASYGSSTSGEVVGSVGHPRVIYDAAQLEELRATCNTFNGPVGTFTSRHSCLFDVNIFVDRLHPVNQGIRATNACVDAPAASGIGGGGDAAAAAAAAAASREHMNVANRMDEKRVSVAASLVDLPGGFIFPVGEPIVFSVTLEPLAHNWPEDCASEEEFLIVFKADTAAWFVVGKQRVRRTLSIMDEETLHFTAVPVPLPPALTERRDDPFRKQQQLQHQRWSDVATPTVEIYWASRDNAKGRDTSSSGAAVAIEVAQFRAFMRIQR